MAQVVAERSLCTRARVGCVVVDPTQRIVATGYNGPAAGFEHLDQPCTTWCPRSNGYRFEAGLLMPDYSDCPSLHAEANALMVGDRRDRLDGTLYCTSHVCLPCAKLIANSGILRVVVVTDQDAPHRNPEASYQLLGEYGIAFSVVAPGLQLFMKSGARLARS